MPNHLLRLENERLEGQKHSRAFVRSEHTSSRAEESEGQQGAETLRCDGDGLDHGLPVRDVHPCL